MRAQIIALVVTLLSWPIAASEPPVVEIDSGPVRGVAEGEVVVYRGLPFAAPPVGELRFRPPQPPQAWEEVRITDSFGPACPQAAREDRPGVLGETSEDCLTLNLWVPEAEEPLPVMVWIHGGAFVIGSGSWPWYDGTEIARRGVLLVTLNYRIGRLGFFAHPALSEVHAGEPLGNYGLMDQIAALRWVRRNIASFGGDPENVTIFGESAGGASVLHLMTSPAAAGLFHKAISQSGGGQGFAPHIDTPRPGAGPRAAVPAERLGERFAQGVGIEGEDAATVAAALRALPIEKLVPSSALGARVAPMIDGRIVVGDAGALFGAGKQHDVPFLVGANSFEGSLARTFGLQSAWIERQLGRFTEEARQLYDAASDPEWALDAYGDAAFVAPARYLARQMAKVSSPAYLYHFSYVSSGRRGQVRGAAHGSDVPYVFSSAARLPGVGASLGDRDREVAAAMTDYWTSFARTGEPRAAGHPDWPPYDPKTDLLLELGETIEVQSGFLRDRLDLHDRRYESLAAGGGDG